MHMFAGNFPELRIAATAQRVGEELHTDHKTTKEKIMQAIHDDHDEGMLEEPDPEHIIMQAQSMDAILKLCRDVKRITGRGQFTKKEKTRGMGSMSEFRDVYTRIQNNVAMPVLRKLFTIGGKCNLMEEIWIDDKNNPHATKDPYKAYTIIHVHLLRTLACLRSAKKYSSGQKSSCVSQEYHSSCC
jgi:hypothetical protein